MSQIAVRHTCNIVIPVPTWKSKSGAMRALQFKTTDGQTFQLRIYFTAGLDMPVVEVSSRDEFVLLRQRFCPSLVISALAL